MPPKRASLSAPPVEKEDTAETRVIVKASKEYFVPPRPKPGRKPVQSDENSSKKAQNRASQRAFRERKNEYVAQLEARIARFEQEEGEKCIHFQGVARRYKDESDRLRLENVSLRSELEALRASMSLASGRYMTPPDEEGTGPTLCLDVPSPPPASHYSFASTPYGSLSPPAGGTCGMCTSAEDCLCHPAPSCGLCTTPENCLCRSSGPTIAQDVHMQADDGSCDLCTDEGSGECVCRSVGLVTDEYAVESVPIRSLKRKKSTDGAQGGSRKTGKLWALEPDGKSPMSVCTGDPATCGVCAGDPMHRAFCTALAGEVCSGGKGCKGCSSRLRQPAGGGATSTLMPSQAWKMLSEHPETEFADLKLLASVVASKTSCFPTSDIRTAVCDDASAEKAPADRTGGSGGRTMRIDEEGVQGALDWLDRHI